MPGGARPSRELTIGLVVPDATYYFPEIIKGAQEAAGAWGARLVLGISRYDAAQDVAQAEQLLDVGADGLLVTPTGSSQEQAWLDDLPVPVVLVERRAAMTPFEHVISDHGYGAQLAVRHLLQRGYQRIGLVWREDNPTSPWAREGYELALTAAGLDPAVHLFPLPPHGRDGAEHQPLLDAVASGSVDAVLVLNAQGLLIPGDLAMVAYDDEVAGLADVPLTAVSPPKRAVGAAALDVLVQRITDPDRPRHRLALLPELHIRSSSGSER
jgi:DNA-binding LacI/PurR family transcriptional regulator